MTEWVLRQPRLAKSSDRSVPARARAGGSPDQWLDAQVLLASGVEPTSFDFFVNWSTRTIEGEVWLKLEAVTAPGAPSAAHGTGLDDVRTVLAPFAEQGRVAAALSGAVGWRPSWMLIPQRTVWTDDVVAALRCPVSADGSTDDVEEVTYATLRDEIARLTGERFRSGKPLYYSTTSLEAALSRTDTLWPGDVDLCLVAPGSGAAVAIIELRKQTQAPPLRVEWDRYYPRPDGRRWDRLALLARHLDVPLIALHYAVDASEERVVAVEVVGDAGSLSEGTYHELGAPRPGGHAAFTERLLEAVSAAGGAL